MDDKHYLHGLKQYMLAKQLLAASEAEVQRLYGLNAEEVIILCAIRNLGAPTYEKLVAETGFDRDTVVSICHRNAGSFYGVPRLKIDGKKKRRITLTDKGRDIYGRMSFRSGAKPAVLDFDDDPISFRQHAGSGPAF